MNPFHGRHFQGKSFFGLCAGIVNLGISYRELQEMLAERGVNVDHTTILKFPVETLCS